MKVTWAYDRGDHRDNQEVEINDPMALDTLLREIQQRNEPVVVTIYGEAPADPDDLPPGLQIGLGHPTHAFVVHIADDGGYLADANIQAPSGEIAFDLGGVPTEYPTVRLHLQPETAIQTAVTFLRTGGEPPKLSVTAL
jgi:hypothetical protein